MESVLKYRGFSLAELLIVLSLIGIFVLFYTSNLSGSQRQQEFENFAREVFQLLEMCRWKALNQRVYAGAFLQESGNVYYASLHLDGNGNGIRTAEVQSGTDFSVYGPVRLQKASGDIHPGILSSIPEIPPGTGWLQGGSDPVKFGKSNIISFSPNGDSSSGTLYLACGSQQQMFAVVVYGATARMTLWKYNNNKWQMVGDR